MNNQQTPDRPLIATPNQTQGPLVPPTAQAPQAKKSPVLKILGLLLLLLVLCGIGIGVLYAVEKFKALEDKTATVQVEKQESEDKNQYVIDNQQVTIADVVEKVSPSVVSIMTSSSATNLFGQTALQRGAGSGVILSKDGFIITNKHVISGASRIVVITSEGHTYENVKIVFVDPANDLAFLKISEVDNLSPIELGDSKTIKVGQTVLAIGNALGQYQNTVTDGIISGVGRSLLAQSSLGSSQVESLNDMLQTSAAINSGNSGGALVNAGGQLIGINTAVASNANGIGFAIPIGSAKGLIKQLGQEKIQRAYLGISYVELTPTLAKQYQVTATKGALIDKNNGIVSASPAEKAGLKNGDIITKINSAQIGVEGGLATLASEYVPGEEVELTVLRGEETLRLKISLGAYQN